MFFPVLSSPQPRLCTSFQLVSQLLDPSSCELSFSLLNLPLPSFGAFTRNLPESAPLMSVGSPTACPVSDSRALLRHVASAGTNSFIPVKLWTYTDGSTRPHGSSFPEPRADAGTRTCALGAKGPHANPLMFFYTTGVPRCTVHVHTRLSRVHMTVCR